VCSELSGRELVLCGQVGKLAWVGCELVRVPVRRHVVRYDVHARHLVFLLPLHAPILEPDLYLAFRQAESMRDLDATPPRQIAVEVELLLQLEGLIPGVRGPLPLRLAVRVHRACKLKVTLLSRGPSVTRGRRRRRRRRRRSGGRSAIAREFPAEDAEEPTPRAADPHHRGVLRAMTSLIISTSCA